MQKTIDEFYKEFNGGFRYISNLWKEAMALDCLYPIREQTAITIAARLRVILNDEGGNTSLLSQIGMQNRFFFTTPAYSHISDMPSNIVFNAKMVSVVCKADKFYCQANDHMPDKKVMLNFDAWWNEIVIDSKHEEFSLITRRDMVLTLADKQGGAYVDAEYDTAYW